MTVAPSMPTKVHMRMMRQFFTWSPTLPMATASAPSSPMEAMLFWSVPQKSAVNTLALNRNRVNRMNTAMDATLHTMTMALRNDALSTPRMTSRVSSHMMTDAMRMQGTVLPGRNAGKKYPSVDIIIVAKATLPSHALSQYPQPEMKPANGPKPSSAYWKMPCRSGRFAPRLASDSASIMKPTPTTPQAMSALPGDATCANWPVMANTPDPMHELITMPISPNRPIPFLLSIDELLCEEVLHDDASITPCREATAKERSKQGLSSGPRASEMRRLRTTT